jgi:hypothetical protein
MTSLLDQPAADVTLAPDVEHIDLSSAGLGAGDLGSEGPEDQGGVSRASLALATVSAGLSSAAAAWMIGGVFRGSEARLIALLGVLIGTGLVYLGSRLRSTLPVYAVLPVALLAGAGLVGSAAGAGTSSLPSLVKDAATSSQVLQPPIDVAPGWRLILVVVLALVASAACSLALSLGRPRFAVAVPAPLTLGAALVQPADSAITTSAVSIGLVMMALATSYAADGSGDGFDARFEVRRLTRSAVAGLLLVAALVAASRLSFLFPPDDPHRVLPPRRPPVSPPAPDVPLYSVKGALPGPLRAGVIDVYDTKEQAWLLPPVDSDRLKRLELPTALPDAPAAFGAAARVTVTVEQARGRALPTLAGTREVKGDATTDYDPRTQGLGLAKRPVFTGLTYELTANPAPSGKQLSAVDLKVPPAMREFLTAPPVPPAVEALLEKAPLGPYARLQSMRTALYKEFVAAGQGRPTDVSADRVVELLAGGTGNPYELTASEALLARWAGVPARIGFGYYNGTARSDGSVEFRPANAATYLEAWFPPYGWVPIIGTPPKAQQSLSNNQRNSDPNIQASPELGINVYLPVLQDNGLPIYAYARYYLVRALPIVGTAAGVLLLYPVALKRVRRKRRAAWAAAHGPAGVVAVAYCELRDQLLDLALPGRGRTPLELVELVAEDEEHAELAWLVTRGLWGDLRTSLTADDAAAAQALAASVSGRLAAAQPETVRLLARVSRASLRAPYSKEVPNVWWQPRLPRPRLALRGLVTRVRPAAATTVVALLGVLTLGGCSDGSAKAEPVVPFPTRLAPTAIAGLQAHEEAKAAEAYLQGAKDKNVVVNQGKVVSFSRNGLVQAALQVAQLKRGYVSSDEDVVRAITKSVGKVTQLADQRGHDLFVLADGSQRVNVWFPTVKAMALLVVRAAISEGAAEALARALIDYGDNIAYDQPALDAAFALLPTPAPSVAPSASPTTEPTP